MITIVSITPVSVDRDSRTFKQATSVARFGYTSIVVEGQRSSLDSSSLPFELRSLGKRVPGKATTSPARDSSALKRQVLSDLISWLSNSPLHMLVGFLRFAYVYVYWHGFLTLLNTPKASLYYLHAFYQFPAVYLLSRIYNTPYIYDAHDFYSRIGEAENLGFPRKHIALPFERWLEAQCVKNAAVVVTVSEGIAKLQKKAFGHGGVVVRNCQDLRLNREPAQRLRNMLGLGADEFLLVVVGQAKKGMAVREMLEAICNLPSKVHVALLGKGYEQYQEHIHSLRLEQQVHIVAPVKPFEVVPFIESADASLILYYPRSINYFYALPNSFFQSIAAGLPILYPELPEIKKIAEQYKLGIMIDPLSPDSISTAVMELIRSPKRSLVYKRNAQRVRQVLSWEREELILRDLLYITLNRKLDIRD